MNKETQKTAIRLTLAISLMLSAFLASINSDGKDANFDVKIPLPPTADSITPGGLPTEKSPQPVPVPTTIPKVPGYLDQ